MYIYIYIYLYIDLLVYPVTLIIISLTVIFHNFLNCCRGDRNELLDELFSKLREKLFDTNIIRVYIIVIFL